MWTICFRTLIYLLNSQSLECHIMPDHVISWCNVIEFSAVLWWDWFIAVLLEGLLRTLKRSCIINASVLAQAGKNCLRCYDCLPLILKYTCPPQETQHFFAVATWSTKNSRYIHTYIHAIVKTSCWFESTWINIWGRAAANLQRLRTRVCCCKLAKMSQGLGLARWTAKCCISEIVNQTRKNLMIST